MLLPNEVIALADARREIYEQEARLQRQLAQLPAQPNMWRRVAANGLVWAGGRLVSWGEGVGMSDCPGGVEVVR